MTMAKKKEIFNPAIGDALAGAVKQKGEAKKGKTPYNTDFPKDCPVEPLGINGDCIYIIDQTRQLRVIKGKDLNRSTIITLFGSQTDLIHSFWPRYSKPDDDGVCRVVGWRPEQAGETLWKEAARRGVIDASNTIRGPGAWLDDDGRLVYHCGDIIYRGAETLQPGLVGKYVYPSAPPKPRPMPSPAGGEYAGELLSVFKTWNWRRPDVDPYLLLGWIGASMLGGALDWRPLVWVTGDKATGKSTLHKVIEHVSGKTGIIQSTDATAAGLWQKVGHASLPVALDELESEEDNRRQNTVIKLARHAASGGSVLRGGTDHKNSDFTVRSCFLFSSILIPPMLGQDISRMAILQLDKITGEPLVLDQKRLQEIGQALRARLMQNWHRFNSVAETFKHALANVGHGGRGSDQFGTLLACYYILVSDYPPHSDTLDIWGDLLKRSTLAEAEEDVADHQRCISHLMTATLDSYRAGEKRTVGEWVLRASGGKNGTQYDASSQEEASHILGNYGLKVTVKRSNNMPVLCFLSVANAHTGLSVVFRDTHWQGRSGANGVWVQALRRIDGAISDQQRFRGNRLSCTSIPLDKIFGGESDDE